MRGTTAVRKWRSALWASSERSAKDFSARAALLRRFAKEVDDYKEVVLEAKSEVPTHTGDPPGIGAILIRDAEFKPGHEFHLMAICLQDARYEDTQEIVELLHALAANCDRLAALAAAEGAAVPSAAVLRLPAYHRSIVDGVEKRTRMRSPVIETDSQQFITNVAGVPVLLLFDGARDARPERGPNQILTKAALMRGADTTGRLVEEWIGQHGQRYPYLREDREDPETFSRVQHYLQTGQLLAQKQPTSTNGHQATSSNQGGQWQNAAAAAGNAAQPTPLTPGNLVPTPPQSDVNGGWIPQPPPPQTTNPAPAPAPAVWLATVDPVGRVQHTTEFPEPLLEQPLSPVATHPTPDVVPPLFVPPVDGQVGGVAHFGHPAQQQLVSPPHQQQPTGAAAQPQAQFVAGAWTSGAELQPQPHLQQQPVPLVGPQPQQMVAGHQFWQSPPPEVPPPVQPLATGVVETPQVAFVVEPTPQLVPPPQHDNAHHGQASQAAGWPPQEPQPNNQFHGHPQQWQQQGAHQQEEQQQQELQQYQQQQQQQQEQQQFQQYPQQQERQFHQQQYSPQHEDQQQQGQPQYQQQQQHDAAQSAAWVPPVVPVLSDNQAWPPHQQPRASQEFAHLSFPATLVSPRPGHAHAQAQMQDAGSVGCSSATSSQSGSAPASQQNSAQFPPLVVAGLGGHPPHEQFVQAPIPAHLAVPGGLGGHPPPDQFVQAPIPAPVPMGTPEVVHAPIPAPVPTPEVVHVPTPAPVSPPLGTKVTLTVQVILPGKPKRPVSMHDQSLDIAMGELEEKIRTKAKKSGETEAMFRNYRVYADAGFQHIPSPTTTLREILNDAKQLYFKAQAWAPELDELDMAPKATDDMGGLWVSGQRDVLIFMWYRTGYLRLPLLLYRESDGRKPTGAVLADARELMRRHSARLPEAGDLSTYQMLQRPSTGPIPEHVPIGEVFKGGAGSTVHIFLKP